ncbi:hypothetical protein TNCV_458331 [Trichonephila clavipes]|nr:hypothetical protein TNCV_458331 [Trichonephila clavipes]
MTWGTILGDTLSKKYDARVSRMISVEVDFFNALSALYVAFNPFPAFPELSSGRRNVSFWTVPSATWALRKFTLCIQSFRMFLHGLCLVYAKSGSPSPEPPPLFLPACLKYTLLNAFT